MAPTTPTSTAEIAFSKWLLLDYTIAYKQKFISASGFFLKALGKHFQCNQQKVSKSGHANNKQINRIFLHCSLV